MNNFKFNLQLFADEDTVSVETLKEQGFSEEELQEHLTPAEPIQEPAAEPIETAIIEPQQEEPVDGDVTTTTEDVEPHADNLKAALKEERDKRKVLAAELAALKAQQPTPQPQQPTPVTPPAQQTSIEDQIASMADDKVRKALGITEDIDTLQYSDPAKYLKYVKSVAKEEYRLESQYEQSQSIRNQNVNFVNELKQQQDFPVLYQFALAELDELPGKQSRVIGEAFSRIDQGVGNKDDHETIRKFTVDCRGKMAGTTTTATVTVPPTTSPLDKAIGLPRATTLSGARTSAMSMVEVERLVSEGKYSQIPKDILQMIDPNLVK